MVFCCCVAKGTVQDDAGEMASIRAYSEDGCSSPYFHETELPPALAAAGVGADQWADVLEGAGKAVQFHWNPYTCVGTWVCCCFTHHKDIAPRVHQLVEALNGGDRLPSGVVVRYQMQWERNIVAAGGSNGTPVEKLPVPQAALRQLYVERGVKNQGRLRVGSGSGSSRVWTGSGSLSMASGSRKGFSEWR